LHLTLIQLHFSHLFYKSTKETIVALHNEEAIYQVVIFS
jgi:hypothetical protein